MSGNLLNNFFSLDTF